MGSNALLFAGGGLVGTSEALGHLVGLDQVVRAPEDRKVLKPSFFDFMARSGVPLQRLDSRMDEVLRHVPDEDAQGRRDFLHHYFSILSGISGGAFLATAMASGLPMVELVRQAVLFPVFSAYFRPDVEEYTRCLQRLPHVPLKLLFKMGRLADALPVTLSGLLRRPRPSLKLLFRVAFELVAAFEGLLPRGIFTGEGLEEYVQKMAREKGFAGSFDEVRAKGKRLYIISDRFNYSAPLSAKEHQSTAIYFGLPPYDQIPIAKALRASCSIPILTTPMSFDDPELGRTFQMVDGAVGKTLGRHKLFQVEQIDLMVSINPIIPFDGPLVTMLDVAEQLYRKLIYSRLKAVDVYATDVNRERTITIESRPEEFFYNMLRLDKMKDALFEGYYQTLKLCAENYVEMLDRLKLGGLTLIPRNAIFELLMGNHLLRDRAYVRRQYQMERHEGGFFRRLDRALATVLGDVIEANPEDIRPGNGGEEEASDRPAAPATGFE